MITNKKRTLVLTALALAFALALGASTVPAQEDVPAAATEAKPKAPAELWGDMLHYIKIARGDLAGSFGKALLDCGAEPREIFRLSEKTPGWQDVLARGSRLEGMKEIVDKLLKIIEKGFEADRADPQRIADAIDMLTKGPAAYELGLKRLIVSGEYALPQLIQKLADPASPSGLKEVIQTVLPRLAEGQGVAARVSVVRGLSVVLQSKDAFMQEAAANALARMEYPQAAPHLKELIERKAILPRTAKVARSALVACFGRGPHTKSTAEMYYDLAKKYYDQLESVAPDARYDKANVWYWREGMGLIYKPVPREIFCDVYAMRLARLALKHDPKFYPAVSLWLAANLKRQADLPAGKKDPTQGADQPAAEYYAMAGSAKYLQDVLAIALKDHNSSVALGAIEALANTAGAKNLVKVSGGAQPLVEALNYSDRRVRFLAAVTLSGALPGERFAGSQLVLPVLNDALRQRGRKMALLLASDEAQRNPLKDAVRAAGYGVIDQTDAAGALAAARSASGVDVAVLAAKSSPAEFVALLRRHPRFVTLPVLIAADTTRLRELAAADKRIVLVGAVSPEAISAGLADAAKLDAAEPLTAEGAKQWAIRAAQSIRLLGMTGNKVFDISQTIKPLAAALNDAQDEVRAAAARALAVMASAEAQQAVATLAVNNQAGRAVRIQAFAALSESLRRFGNQLTDELAQAVLDIVAGKAPLPLRNAAAQALGAMNLPSERIKELILQDAR